MTWLRPSALGQVRKLSGHSATFGPTRVNSGGLGLVQPLRGFGFSRAERSRYRVCVRAPASRRHGDGWGFLTLTCLAKGARAGGETLLGGLAADKLTCPPRGRPRGGEPSPPHISTKVLGKRTHGKLGKLKLGEVNRVLGSNAMNEPARRVKGWSQLGKLFSFRSKFSWERRGRGVVP